MIFLKAENITEVIIKRKKTKIVRTEEVYDGL